MTPIPAEKIVDGLSEDLQDLVVREAYIRQRKDGLQAQQEELRKKRETFEQTRSPFAMFRGKEAKEEMKSQGQKLQDDATASERALTDCNAILEQCDKIIEADLQQYFLTQSEEFRKAIKALELVPVWERFFGQYEAALKQYIRTLGVARNQMSSGFNRKTNTFAPGALEAFSTAQTAASALEGAVAIPNQVARQYRELRGVDPAPNARVPDHIIPIPYLTNHNVAKQVAGLKTAAFEAAYSTIGTLLSECEKLDQEGVPLLHEELLRVRASQEAEQKNQIARALRDIRAMADSLVDAAQAEAVWVSMQARFIPGSG